MEALDKIKDALIAEFSLKIAKLLRKLLNDNVDYIKRYGFPNLNAVSSDELSTILRNYAELSNNKAIVYEDITTLTVLEQQALVTTLEEKIKKNVAFYTDVIDKTNRKQIMEAYNEAAIITTEKEEDRSLIPKYFGLFLLRKFSGRPNVIATTTTQSYIETTRYEIATVKYRYKTWYTRSDGRVRPAHTAAAGQKVDINALFNVGGEGLMYPGDRRGSLKNIINCRCNIRYTEE